MQNLPCLYEMLTLRELGWRVMFLCTRTLHLCNFSLNIFLKPIEFFIFSPFDFYLRVGVITDPFLLIWIPAQLPNHVQLFATPWTVAHQAPLSIKFSRQEYWSGLPRDPPDPGCKFTSLVSPALAGRFFTTVLPEKSLPSHRYCL